MSRIRINGRLTAGRSIPASFRAVGTVLLCIACGRPKAAPVPTATQTVMAPSLARFEALASTDSATFRFPLPPQSTWRWNVVPQRMRPGTEYSFEAQWNFDPKNSRTRSSYVDGISLQINSAAEPASGTLSELANAGNLLAVATSERRATPNLIAGAEPALHVRTDSAGVVLVLGPSDRLERLLRARPDSTFITVILSPLGTAFSRNVPIRYRNATLQSPSR
jgi:hypothetical protein